MACLQTILAAASVAAPYAVPLTHQRRQSSTRRRLASSSTLIGSMSDDYTVPLLVDGATFHVNVDTGSAALAVAGAPTLGCPNYVDSTVGCDDGGVGVNYGSGGWRGVQCHREVSLGGLTVPHYEFSSVLTEKDFLTCPGTSPSSSHAPSHMLRKDLTIDGILGLALSGLTGVTPSSAPLLYRLFDAHPQLPRVFGLQCCAYDALTGLGGDGALDIGGASSSHHHGEIRYAAVTEGRFFGVEVLDLRTVPTEAAPTSVSLLRAEPGDDASSPLYSDAIGRTFSKHIVDSGTSLILLRKATAIAVREALHAAAGDSAPPLSHGFWNASACAAIDTSRLPPLDFLLRAEADGQPPLTLRIPPSRYIRRATLQPAKDDSYCALATSGDGKTYSWLDISGGSASGAGILGQVLFEQYYVTHEIPNAPGKPRIGFAPLAGCDGGDTLGGSATSPITDDMRVDQLSEASERPAALSGPAFMAEASAGMATAGSARQPPSRVVLVLISVASILGLVAVASAVASVLAARRARASAEAAAEGGGEAFGGEWDESSPARDYEAFDAGSQHSPLREMRTLFEGLACKAGHAPTTG